ncbi:virulence-associated protein VapD [Aeromonas hydrophila]|uniref:hypothetical protein n=1 Tax=Aeromonas hydrophila TaxID=644 RepID=UPI002169B03A|nr:hypothetical protein [Aeromonas hydrophila]MCS3768359.1 virulence-associated protein VapD [Aeromonas hydrophila]
MRYLLFLLSLSPVITYAGCIAGVSYGQYPITAGNPVCAPYTGSSLGGCSALCGGAAGSTVCVEFPNNSPPTKGPYITTGNECTYKDGSESGSFGNSGGNPSGVDGTHESPTGLVDVGQILVGDKLTTDFGVGFNSVSNNINKSATKIQKSVKDLAKQLEDARGWDNANYMDVFKTELQKISYNTSGIGSAGSNGNHELTGYLKSINEKTVLDPTMWNNHHAELMQVFNDIRKDMSYMGGFPNQQELININQNTNDMKNSLLNNESQAFNQFYMLSQILDELKKDKGNGNGGGEGDKPCEGPLCKFTPPSGVGHGSSLSSVFDESSITDIKGKVADKNKAINDKLQEIKSVFKQSDITISGTYDNDYQNIMGAKVDLSGKSNWELFFNSGPRAALWLLAILIAFGILLGGRKNA